MPTSIRAAPDDSHQVTADPIFVESSRATAGREPTVSELSPGAVTRFYQQGMPFRFDTLHQNTLVPSCTRARPRLSLWCRAAREQQQVGSRFCLRDRALPNNGNLSSELPSGLLGVSVRLSLILQDAAIA
jgi:hypothetical protein